MRRLQAEKISGRRLAAAQFAPGRFEKMVPLHQTAALETYCGSRSACSRPTAATALRVPRLADVQGTIEAAEADLPLVIRTPRGFGQVIFLAADLDEPPLSKWSDRPLLVAKLLDMPDRPRRGIERKHGHDALRLQRSVRPVAQRAGSIFRRATGAVLARGGLDRGLHPADRAGRLFLPPQNGRPDGVDVADVSADRRCW